MERFENVKIFSKLSYLSTNFDTWWMKKIWIIQHNTSPVAIDASDIISAGYDMLHICNDWCDVSVSIRLMHINLHIHSPDTSPWVQRTITVQKKQTTIHQVTTMLATSKIVLFPGHNHLLTTGTNDPTLWLSLERLYSENTNLHQDHVVIQITTKI